MRRSFVQTSLLASSVDKNSTKNMATRPPLNAIFVFCAAARHGSFKLAAQALCVTPGAVSRQIQALEAYLGHALFDRRFRDVQLTRKGRQLHDRVADKMAAVEMEVDLLRSGGRKAIVRVDSGVTLAMHWLIPRLASFHEANPGIQVQLSTTSSSVDIGKRVDLHICRDPADFAGLEPEVFMEEYSVLVASPKLVKTPWALSLQRLKGLQRIAAVSRPDLWRQWSSHHGWEPSVLEPTLEFDNTVLAIQAAAEGLGVMVVPEIFVSGMLQGKMLVPLTEIRVRTGSYCLLMRARRDAGSVRRFTDWLRASKDESVLR
jgi:LysR family glycine cleavage system transcriptional activator